MDENNEAKDGVCILSFDNGGPGTYSQLLILKEYMNRLAVDLQVEEDKVYPADYFDLMGGAGFGGLIAFMLGHLKMNVDEIIEELLTLTDLLSFDDSQDSVDREENSKILTKFLESMLQANNIAPDTKMNESWLSTGGSKVALFVASSTNIAHPHIFRTYSSRGSALKPTIAEALCATMAIQSHFLPVKIGPRRRQELFVGGALGANNPTRLLLGEASRVFGKDRRVAQIISLGCGLPRVLSTSSSDTTEIDRLLKEITTDCEMVASELSTRLLNIDAYLRLNVSRGLELFEMKGWNDLGAVGTHTATYLATTVVSESIDDSLWRLVEKVGSVSLGQLTHSSGVKNMAKKAPPVSPYFVLREKPWKTMVDYLVNFPSTRQKILPITGMGGCGKTQMVSYFVQEYTILYAQTVYVDASSSSSIKADLQLWARALGNGHESDLWEDAFRVLSSVPPGEQWILILDNADDPGLNINSFLPGNINITILITSRNRDLGNLSTTTHLELGEMTVSEAVLAMVQAARRSLPFSDEEMNSLHVILKELGYLPVALVQASTFCYQLSSTVGEVFYPYTFTQYLCLFKSHRSDLMKRAVPASLDNYQRGVYTALDLSYKALTHESQKFLHIISCFHHAEIPLASFSWAARHAFRDPRSYLLRDEIHKATISNLHAILCKDMEWNELRLQGIIQILRSFSLVITSSSNTSLFLHLHPLVQAWSRDMDSVASQRYQAMAVQVVTTCGGEENFELNRLLLPHMLYILKSTESKQLHVNDLLAFGRSLLQQGHFHESGQLFETALEAMKHSSQATYIYTLEVTFQLALSYLAQGRWSEAEKLQIDIFEQRRRILGAEHPDTMRAAAYLAEIYNHEGRWTEAEKLNLEVLQQRRRILGVEHPETIRAAANLASTYHCQGRWAECERLEVEVLEQRKRILGMENPDTITAAVTLAATYRDQGRWTESEELGLEVCEQQKRILGLEHPDTLTASANLASTYRNQGRWTETEKLEVDVLEQRTRILGVDHPDTITAAANLASTYYCQGRWNECEKLEVEVVERRKRIQGTEHPHTITAVANLAATYHSQGLWTHCEKLELEVLEQFRRILGIEHPDTIRAAANLASTYYSQGRWTESERLEVEVLEQRRRVLGMEHPETILAGANLASTYHEQGRWTESEKLDLEVLEQRRRILGIEHPDTIAAAANLAATYHEQGRWVESENLDLEVLELSKRILGTEHPDTIAAAVNLALTYGAQGRWEDDATFLAPAVQLSIKVLGLQHPYTKSYLKNLAFVYNKLGKTIEAEAAMRFLTPDTSFDEEVFASMWYSAESA